MKKITFLFLMLVGMWTLQSCDNAGNNKHADTEEHAEDANEDKLKGDAEDDAEKLVKIASSSMAEVEHGKLAMQKGSSKTVKDFAQMMVNDHSKANQELMALAASKNITLPSAMGSDHQKHQEELSKLSGKEFDEKYMDIMVKMHKQDVELMEDLAEDAKDPDIKAFAAKTLPTLKMHLDHAEGKEDHTDHKH